MEWRDRIRKVYILLVVCCIPNISSNSDQSENDEKTEQTNAFVRSLNRFSFDFMKLLVEGNNENVVFSPMSISTAVSALFAGTKNKTRAEIVKAFHWERREQDELLQGMAKQTNSLLTNQKCLNVANKIWTDKSFKILDSFSEIQKKYFKSDIGQENFSENPEDSRSKINNWVQQKTNDKIKDLFPQGSIEKSTKLVLANALYFKGLWSIPFDKKYTHKHPFYMENGEEKNVDYMWQNSKFVFGQTGQYNLVEIPYVGKTFSMVIVIPKKQKSKLDDLTTQMGDGNLEKAIEKFRQQNKRFQMTIDIFLPKFKIEQKIDLKEKLKKLGICDLFTRGKADLSSINGNHLLYCSSAYHKAFVEVNEEGTEAGAATGFGMHAMSMPPQIRINRSFLFFIIHKDSKLVIFSGRVMSPLNDE